MSVTGYSIAISRRWEGCAKKLPDGRFIAYWDATGGKWTIGWGSTGGDIFEGVIWTQAQCDERHLSMISNLVDHVSKMVTRPVSDIQMACMVDLAYNTGLDEKHDGVVTAFGIDSSLLRYVNAGEFDKAADEFPKWCHAHDSHGNLYVVQGLYNRRIYDRDLFLGKIQLPDA